MPHGPGKYDDECTVARMCAGAEGAALIVFNGRDGSGFAVQGPPHLLRALPHMLRTMADQIERDGSPPGEAI